MVLGDNVKIDTKLVEDKYKTGTGEVLRLGLRLVVYLLEDFRVSVVAGL